MQTFTIYVGSDNDTGEIDLERIAKIATRQHDSFTVWLAQGHWRGHNEDTAVLIVSDHTDKVRRTIESLRDELHQDAIAYQQSPSIQIA